MSIRSIHSFTQQVMHHVNRRLIGAVGPEPKEGGEFTKILQAVQSAGNTNAAREKTGKTLADYRLGAIAASPVRQARPEAVRAVETVRSAPVAAAGGTPFTPHALGAPTPEKNRIEKAIGRASDQYGVSPHLVRAVIQAESNFNPRAVSKAGARGLMQLMPATARELGVKDAFDIEQNISGGTKYLRRMLDLFGGDTEMALAAYNAGPGAVIRSGGRVPYRETVAYVEKVMTYKSQGELA